MKMFSVRNPYRDETDEDAPDFKIVAATTPWLAVLFSGWLGAKATELKPEAGGSGGGVVAELTAEFECDGDDVEVEDDDE